MDCRHPGAGIVPGIVAGEGVHDIRAEGHLFCRTPDPFTYRVIESLRKRDVGWEREVDDRDTGILAERDAELLCQPDVLQDIVKLPAGDRVRLGSGGTLDHPDYVRGREMAASRNARNVASARADQTGSVSGFCIYLYW